MNSPFRLTDLFSKYKTQLEQDLKNLLAYHDNSNAQKYSTTNENQTQSDGEITRICDEVMYCLQPAVRSNITVFNLNSEKDLSYTIFQSIGQCKSNHSISMSDIELFLYSV